MIDSEETNLRFGPHVLGKLAELIAAQREVFTLLVSDAPNEKVIYYANGGFRLLSSGDRTVGDVESFLLRTGSLSIDELHEVLETCRQKSRSFKESVIERKLLSLDGYRQVVERLVRDELYDLAFWTDASFTCYGGSPPQEIYTRESKALVASPDCRQLADDLRKWIDCWERVRPSLHSDRARIRSRRRGVLALEKLQGEEHEVERRILEHVVQGTDLRSLWLQTSFELPVICDHLARFVDERWIEIVRPETAPTSPEALAAEISRLEDGIDRVIGRELVRHKLVHLYRRAGRDKDAYDGLIALAEDALKRAQWPIAVEHYKEALSIAPKEIRALEALMSIQLKQHLEREAIRAAHQHAYRLIELGDAPSAREVEKLLRRLVGGGLEADSLLAAVSAASGDIHTAVEQYLAIAESHERNGRRRDAIQLLRQAVKTCNGAERLVERLRTLEDEATSRKPSWSRQGRPSRGGPVGKTGKIAVAGTLLVACVAVILHLSGVFTTSEATAANEDAAESSSSSGADPELAEIPIDGRPGIDVSKLFGVESAGGAGAEEEDDDANDAERGAVAGSSSSRPHGTSSASFDPSATRSRIGDSAAPWTASRSDLEASQSEMASEPGFRLLPHHVPLDWSGESTTLPRLILEKASWHARRAKLSAPRLRLLDADLLVVFEDGGTLIGLSPRSGEQRFLVEGRTGTRWAFAYRGLRICRWEKGRHALVFHPLNGTRRATRWIIPDETEALAIGVDRFILRQGRRTALYSEDGRLLRQARFHAWEEGALVDDWLVLYQSPAKLDSTSVWVIHAPSWTPLWCLRAEDDAWSLR